MDAIKSNNIYLLTTTQASKRIITSPLTSLAFSEKHKLFQRQMFHGQVSPRKPCQQGSPTIPNPVLSFHPLKGRLLRHIKVYFQPKGGGQISIQHILLNPSDHPLRFSPLAIHWALHLLCARDNWHQWVAARPSWLRLWDVKFVLGCSACLIPTGPTNTKWQELRIFSLTGWCSTLTFLLIFSSFNRENGHPLLMCPSLSTA